MYQGEWKYGKMTGYGELNNVNTGSLYIGYFLNNQYTGFGILRNFKEKNLLLDIGRMV